MKRKFKQGIGAVPGKPGKWDINYQVNGKRITERIDAATREEALAIRLSKKASLRNRSSSLEEAAYSLDEAFAKIVCKIKNEIARGERTKTALSEVIPPFKRFFFDFPKHCGKNWIAVTDFTPNDLEEYKNYYGVVLGKASGVSSELSKIQNILTHAYNLGLISSKKLFELRQIKRPRKNVRALIGNPDIDFIKVLTHIKARKPRLFEFLSFLASTGRRPREVRHYLREQVNLEGRFIHVEAAKTKNRRPNNVILDDDLLKIVKKAVDFSRKLDSKYLFLNDWGRQFSANNPQLNFQIAARECGIPNWQEWCVYQLKKRFITICSNNGLAPEAIQQITGHADLASVMKAYSFPDRSQAERVLQAGKLRV